MEEKLMFAGLLETIKLILCCIYRSWLHRVLMASQFITLLLPVPCFRCLAPSPHWAVTPSWQLSEMEERILAIETHIDPLGRSPHPNLLTPGRKKRETKKKSRPSALFSPPHAKPHPSTLSRPSTLQVAPPPFGPSSFLMIVLPIFHLTPSSPDNPSPTSDAPVPCVCGPVQHFFFFFSSQDPIFRFLSYFCLVPIYLSPSRLCICSFLPRSAHLLLCVHKHKRSNTHSRTSISLCTPPTPRCLQPILEAQS